MAAITLSKKIASLAAELYQLVASLEKGMSREVIDRVEPTTVWSKVPYNARHKPRRLYVEIAETQTELIRLHCETLQWQDWRLESTPKFSLWLSRDGKAFRKTATRYRLGYGAEEMELKWHRGRFMAISYDKYTNQASAPCDDWDELEVTVAILDFLARNRGT